MEMTTQRALELLQLLRHSCAAAQGNTGDALDLAIDSLQRSIVRSDIESIIAAVTRETRVTDDEMCGPGRNREYTEARAIVAWLAYNFTHMTQSAIGKRLHVTHATVIYYLRMVEFWLDEPRRNMKGARLTTRLMREIEEGL